MNICEHNKCTGCALCTVICPKKCISLEENNEGFLYPVINKEKCISCGLCEKKCPSNYPIEKNTPTSTAISSWSADDKERFSSSSGGVFPELAKYVLNNKGVVYGAAFQPDYTLKHIRISDLEQLPLLKGSKYFQSDIRDCFSFLKDDLCSGKEVLFSGTGCQIAAIKRFLGDIDLSRLYFIEILCHGVPSKKTIDSYIQEINPNSKPTKVNFRDKSRYGWEYSCVFEVEYDDGIKHYGRSSTDLFYLGFLNELFLRESCYSCPYVGKSRVGDITLADYWRVTSDDIPEMTDEDKKKGISLVLTNNEKGELLISRLTKSGQIICHGADLQKAAEHNQSLKGNYQRPNSRDIFFKYNEKYGYRKALFKIYPKTIAGIRFRQAVKKIMGDGLYSKVKSILLKG